MRRYGMWLKKEHFELAVEGSFGTTIANVEKEGIQCFGFVLDILG